MNRTKKYTRLAAIGLVMIGAACSEDAGPGNGADMGIEDQSTDGPVDVADMTVDQPKDVEEDLSNTPDMPISRCAQAGGLPQDARAVELAQSPARCGQAAHQWLDDDRLGDVVSEGNQRNYTAAALKNLAEIAGIELPFELRYDVRVSVVEYTTQDRGELINATAFLAAPVPSEEQDDEFQMLMYLHGTSGFTDGCGPSRDDASLLLGAVIASSGYVLVGPDYVGLKGRGDDTGFLHPYLVGQSVAMSSLDAARAVLKMDLYERQGACLKDELLLLGGSQGGHAALWVDRLLPYYAPEFELLGTVATVPPADLFGQLTRAIEAPVLASANTAAFFASAAPWYGFGDRLDEVFASPLDVDLPAAMAASCNPSDTIEIPTDGNLTDLFNSDFLDARAELANDPVWGCMALENGLTTTSIERIESDRYADTYSIMWVMGEGDTLVHTPIERDSFLELCDQGMTSMTYLECSGASHTQATAQALPEILVFLNGRAQRQAIPSGLCELSAPVACE